MTTNTNTIQPLPGSYEALRREYESLPHFAFFKEVDYICNCCGSVFPVKWAYVCDEVSGAPWPEDPVQDSHCPDCGSDKTEWK